MKNKQEGGLILGRFEKQYLLKKTDNKKIWILQNTTSSEKLIGKFQSKNKLDKVNVKNVLHEASFLQQMQGHTGIPLMYWSGVEGVQIVVISQYLGYTLQQRLQQCGGKFCTKTICLLGIMVIDIIRNLHEKGIVHRNINPNSLQFGRGLKSSDLYFNDLIDCKKYRNKKSYAHIPHKKNIKYSYDNKFAATRFHDNQQISRIDDIQSVVRMLIYFNSGEKPTNKGEYQEESVPNYLKEMFQKCQTYNFADEPVYQWFTQKLNSVLFHNSQQNDGVFQWMVSPNRLDLLRVKKHVVSLAVQEDRQTLAQFYDPYEQAIDIDQISSKHYKLYGLNQGQMQHHVVDNKKSLQFEQKLKKRKTMHKQKPDCSIM